MGWETYDEDTRRAFEQEVERGGEKCPACGTQMYADYETKMFRCLDCEERRNAPCSHRSTTRKYNPGEHEGLGAVNVCDDCGEEV